MSSDIKPDMELRALLKQALPDTPPKNLSKKILEHLAGIKTGIEFSKLLTTVPLISYFSDEEDFPYEDEEE